MVRVSIHKALKDVADNPVPTDDQPINHPVHELVARALFTIANNPSDNVRGSHARAVRAQKIILNRLVGTRRTGSHPAAQSKVDVEFVDLTQAGIE